MVHGTNVHVKLDIWLEQIVSVLSQGKHHVGVQSRWTHAVTIDEMSRDDWENDLGTKIRLSHNSCLVAVDLL